MASHFLITIENTYHSGPFVDSNTPYSECMETQNTNILFLLDVKPLISQRILIKILQAALRHLLELCLEMKIYFHKIVKKMVFCLKTKHFGLKSCLIRPINIYSNRGSVCLNIPAYALDYTKGSWYQIG